MKRGIRPIAPARDEPVLEWIYITIFDMARIVSLIADQMLPKSALPDAAFVACDAHGAEPLPLRQRSREAALDQAPARGKIAIAWRQVPDRMQMIGQHDECADREGMALASRGDRLAQGRDMVDQQGLSPLRWRLSSALRIRNAAHRHRRPGERRDPYSVSLVLSDAVRRLSHNHSRQGLWVPAFAGTTWWIVSRRTLHFSLNARINWSLSGLIKYDSMVRSPVWTKASTGMPGISLASPRRLISSAGIETRMV